MGREPAVEQTEELHRRVETLERDLADARKHAAELRDRSDDLEVKVEMMEEARAFLERGTAVLAQRIQMSVLPPVLAVPGFELAARMQPGEVVGGDYYDVRPVEDGMWLAIGDVSGHGVTAGLVTLLTHGMLTGLSLRSADTSPAPVVRALNDMLVDALARMGVSEHMTFSLLRIHRDGRLVWAGAHEDILVLRARTGRCERLPTAGTWLGVSRVAGGHMVDVDARLEPGDLLCTYTDGIIEARDERKKQFGVDGLAAVLESMGALPVATICERVFAAVTAHEPTQSDDRTLVLVRMV